MGQHLLADVKPAPTGKPLEHTIAVSKPVRHKTPLRACAQNSQHCFHKPATSALASNANAGGFLQACNQFHLLLVAQLALVHANQKGRNSTFRLRL